MPASYGVARTLMAARKQANASRKMTIAEKYAELKRQTEAAGMIVREVGGRLVVSRKKPAK
jgi:hypothetical protein